MTNIADADPMHEAAREAIDEAQLAEILEQATDGAYDEDAGRALREVLADEIVAISRAAIDRARRRGNPLTGDDVGDAADERLSCCVDRRRHRNFLPEGGEPAMSEWP